jgi:hypothetical protein
MRLQLVAQSLSLEIVAQELELAKDPVCQL